MKITNAQILSNSELSCISGGGNWKNYPKPWYASGNVPPSGYYDMWDIYQPWTVPCLLMLGL